MKHLRQTTRLSQQILTASVLTSILSLGVVGMTLIDTATADSVGNPQGVASPKQSRSNPLPSSVINAVGSDISRNTGIPSSQLSVVSYSQESWLDSCLGLGQLNELCAQVLIENGWRVVMSDGRQNWIYRTDSTGSTVRIEVQQPPSGSNLPNSVAKAVLQKAATLSNLPSSQLRIVRAERKDWLDDCAGLEDFEYDCTPTIVPGWHVTVAGGQQNLVYRTDESGSLVQLDQAATYGRREVVQIPRSELPPLLTSNTVFREIVSGGFAGQTVETYLLEDGRVIQVQMTPNGTPTQREISQISRREVQQFQQFLERVEFAQFNQLSYPALRGAADYMTVTLTGKAGTIRYADTELNHLPESLQFVVYAWNDIVSGRRNEK